MDTPCRGLSAAAGAIEHAPEPARCAAIRDQPGLPEVTRGEVRQVGIGVVDPGEEADLAAFVEALDAAAHPAGQRGVKPERRAGKGHPLHSQLRVQVGVAAVVVQGHERVEQVDSAGQEDRYEHRGVGRGRGLGRRRVEHLRERHGAARVERQARAEAGGKHLPAGERRPPEVLAADVLLGVVEVVAGVVAAHVLSAPVRLGRPASAGEVRVGTCRRAPGGVGATRRRAGHAQ